MGVHLVPIKGIIGDIKGLGLGLPKIRGTVLGP